MVDVPKEMEHQENLLAIKKRSPSFEAQDPLKEVNLGTNTNVRLTRIVLSRTIMKFQNSQEV